MANSAAAASAAAPAPEDNAAAPAAAATAAEGAAETPQGRSRISKANAKRLQDYFSSAGFQRNTRMPAERRDPTLDGMITEMKITRRQASYQLRRWKLVKFDGLDLVVNASEEEIREAINDRLSQSPEG